MLFIGFIVITVTFVLLFLVKKFFDNFKIEIKVPFKLNILSNKVVILSKKGCPWCEKMDPYLSVAKNEYIKILMNEDGTFTFDEKFIELEQGERESIIKGSTELMEHVGYYFPTIIHRNDYILGFPDEKTLNRILND